VTQPVPNTNFQVAGATFPISQGGDLYSVDPVLAYALDYWQFVIETYVGDFILAAAVMAPTQAGGPLFTSAVGQTFPDDPTPYMASEQLLFPILGAYRKTSKYTKHSAGYYHDRVAFDLIYVLPPLDAMQAAALLPARRAVASAVRVKTDVSIDPGYAPKGGVLGQSPWGISFAGVEEIGFDGDAYGAFPGTGSLVFPYLVMSGFFLERDMYVPGQKFAGGDVAAGIVAPDGTSIQNVVQVATQQPPTLTGLSVTTGTMAGGTSVTITGSLFLNGPPLVYFGPTLATNIVWNSATSVTCSTPAASGSGSVSVSVRNRDGQSAVLPNAFTFTSP
jgi:hypothetical protein